MQLCEDAMDDAIAADAPRRVSDLVHARKTGADVTVQLTFDILPVDFEHREHPFRAYIFLCRYSGAIAGRPYEFRKCYARGCPNNLCTHVSQAVIIANRYLQRDLAALNAAGIAVAERAFSLADMIVKFENLKQQGRPALTVPDLIEQLKGNASVSVVVSLEAVPAVEHFANQKSAQTFFTGEFTARVAGESYQCHRCFACYSTQHEAGERPLAVEVANARLELIYQEFDRHGIRHDTCYFN
jgi:hypothetical protein